MIVQLDGARRQRAQTRSRRRRVPGESLTPGCLAVLRHVAEGMSNHEISIELGISEQTVKNQLSRILAELAVDDRTAAVVIALQRGWLRLRSLRVRQRPPREQRPAGLTSPLAA